MISNLEMANITIKLIFINGQRTIIFYCDESKNRTRIYLLVHLRTIRRRQVFKYSKDGTTQQFY